MPYAVAVTLRWVLSFFTVLLLAWCGLAGYFVQACSDASQGWSWALFFLVLSVSVPAAATVVVLVATPFTIGLALVRMTLARRVAVLMGVPLAMFALVWVVVGVLGVRESCSIEF